MSGYENNFLPINVKLTNDCINPLIVNAIVGVNWLEYNNGVITAPITNDLSNSDRVELFANKLRNQDLPSAFSSM